MKIIESAAVWLYLLLLYLIMLLIDAGLRASKYVVGQTGWRWTIDVFKALHICGEKLSRHIRRMIPE